MHKFNFKSLVSIDTVNVANKTVVVRVDFNVPLKDGVITDSSRIDAARKTIDYLLDNNCKVILLSHLSRIKSADDIKSGKKSLLPVYNYLKTIYGENNVFFATDGLSPVVDEFIKKEMKPKQIMLFENTRYQDFDLENNKLTKKESKCDDTLAKKWANLADVFVNDAFATIHRCHASNYGIIKHCKQWCIGFLIKHELENILKFHDQAPKPIVSIVGGAKISDKVILLNRLMAMSDNVLIGGGMSFLFLKALNYDIGKSLFESEMLQVASDIYKKYKDKIILPVDVIAANEFADVKGKKIAVGNSFDNLMGLDVGPKTTKLFTKKIKAAKTIFWNGPTGVFEFKHYQKSSKKVAKAISCATKHGGFSLIGGGDTAFAATKFCDKSKFSFVSTGGGATLAIIQGSDLPGLNYFNK